MNKKSFLIYQDYYAPIRNLSDEDLGKLFRSIFEYQINGEEPDTDSSIYMPFLFFKNQFNIDNNKYQEKCDRNAENARKRWQKNNASGSDGMRSHKPDTSNADNDNDNGNGNDNGNDNGKEDLINPFSPDFMRIWKGWIDYKRIEHKFRYRSVKSEQMALNSLNNLSGGDEEKALRIIEQSISNGWKGFFAIQAANNRPEIKLDPESMEIIWRN